MRKILTLMAGLVLMAPAVPAAAADPNPFAPALFVNGRIITNYEIAQREKFLEAVEGPGDRRAEAIKALIDDKIRLFEAAKYGFKPDDAQVTAGMDEFAARGKMTADQMVGELQKYGVDPQTFRDFIAAGVAWRAVVQGTIAPGVNITDAQTREAQSLSLAHGAPRLLLSEIILPAAPEYLAQSVPLAEQLSQTLHGDAAFAAAAKQYSASDSAKDGGKLQWISADTLPHQVVQAVIGLSPGQVSKPVSLPNAIGIFEMRGLGDSAPPPAGSIQVHYAEFLIPGVRTPEVAAEAARIRAKAETCNDLYGLARGKPPAVLTETTQLLPQVPADVALELAKLNPGAASTTLTRGGDTVYLMLCDRIVVADPEPPLSQLRDALYSAVVNELSDQKLDQLRAAAIIRKP